MHKNLFNQIVKNLPEVNNGNLYDYIQKIKDSKEEIKAEQIAALDISCQDNDLENIQNIADQITQNFKKVVILGVGGSSLAGKTLIAIQDNPQIDIEFLESIDANTIDKKLNKINLNDTFFLIISKSGETVETLCQTLIIIDKLKQNNSTNIGNKFAFITQNQQNSISQIANEIQSPIYEHPNNIGGRFSYLTIVGLLPAALAGLDIKKIRNGAKKTLEQFFDQDCDQNQISQICALQLYLFDKGFSNNVIMPYIDSLKDFTDWYRQLWAESLGKDGFGSTPINSMGTIDQHSQLQLYLEGPRDKFFTFITNKNHSKDFYINRLEKARTRFDKKNLSEIVEIEQKTTIEVLEKRNLPIRVLELESLDEEILSSLMMQMFLETIIIAKAKNIDPFDQPAVELRKSLAREYLTCKQ